MVVMAMLAALQMSALAQSYEELVKMDKDIENSNLRIGAMGDVFSGYSIGWESAAEGENHKYAARWYQNDILGRHVRQIVVLKEKWDNVPKDILAGDGGYKIVAVTPKEYSELKYYNEIWGEIWEFAFPEGINKYSADTIPFKVGYELTCYSNERDLWYIPEYGIDQRKYSREVMIYTDSVTNIDYMTVAENKQTGQADYLPSKTGGKYDTRFIAPTRSETEYWWEKFNKWQQGNDYKRRVNFLKSL